MWSGKHKFNYWWRRLWLPFFLLALLIVALPPFWRKNSQQTRVNQEIADLKAQVAANEAKNSDLKKMVDYLQSDSFMEEKGRLDFGLQKPGERVVAVKDLATDTTASSSQPLSQPPATSVWENYQHWLDYFFGH